MLCVLVCSSWSKWKRADWNSSSGWLDFTQPHPNGTCSCLAKWTLQPLWLFFSSTPGSAAMTEEKMLLRPEVAPERAGSHCSAYKYMRRSWLLSVQTAMAYTTKAHTRALMGHSSPVAQLHNRAGRGDRWWGWAPTVIQRGSNLKCPPNGTEAAFTGPCTGST